MYSIIQYIKKNILNCFINSKPSSDLSFPFVLQYNHNGLAEIQEL